MTHILSMEPLLEFERVALSPETTPAARALLKFPFEALPSVPGALPSSCPLDVFRIIIAVRISAFVSVDVAAVFSAIELPKDTSKYHFAIPTPRLRLKGNPVQLSSEIIKKFVCDKYITSAAAVGQFLNFKISSEVLQMLLVSSISTKPECYGENDSGIGKVAALDMSSPNIAKPFHAGHLRSTIIGNFIRNALKANGWKTVAINYLGDWGKQYGLLAVGFVRHGSEELLEKDPIHHLFEVYVKINAEAEADQTIHDEARAYFKRMEDGEEEALKLWCRFRTLSIVGLEKTYKRLDVKFDVYDGESMVDNMEEVSELLRAKNLLQDSDGAMIIDLEAEKLGKAVVIKRDGTKLYLTRDIGAALLRHKRYAFDRLFYVVCAQQELHFKQLFTILGRLGLPWASKCQHVQYGMVSGMSTRKGTVVFLDDILNQTKEQMLEVMRRNMEKFEKLKDPEAIADIVGISAVIVQDLSARRIRDYEFEWSRMFSFEGDTGPYLQYAHTRLCSIERAAGELVSSFAALSEQAEHLKVFRDYPSPSKEMVERLIFLLARYPEIVRQILAGYTLEPCQVVTYLFLLCRTVSSLYEVVRAMDNDMEVRRACLLLYMMARITLGNGLRLIGLTPLEKM